MNSELLQQLGLNQAQAKTYLTLITKGGQTPPQLSKLTGEKRTNTYMVLEKLLELGLVEKLEGKTLKYQALNPMAIERLADERRKKLATVEQQVKSSMPTLLSYFYSFTEKPGIRLLEGTDGLREAYKDTLRTKQDIYFLRAGSMKEVATLGQDFFTDYQQKRAKLGIKTFAFTQDTPSSREQSVNDEKFNKKRMYIPENAYVTPVEMNIYGDKVAFMSYGEEIMCVIIHSPPIASAMREVLKMVESGLTKSAD